MDLLELAEQVNHILGRPACRVRSMAACMYPG
jgi:hypothetical protein